MTCIIIYQRKALLGQRCLLSETRAFTVVPYHFSFYLCSPHSPVGCCYVLCAIGLHGPVGRDALPTLGLSSAGVQASSRLLFPQSSKMCCSQVGSLTLPADSSGVSVCARIFIEILHSSCTGIFSQLVGLALFSIPSGWELCQLPARLHCLHTASTEQ